MSDGIEGVETPKPKTRGRKKTVATDSNGGNKVVKDQSKEYVPGKTKHRCDFDSWDEYNKYLSEVNK